MEQKTIVIKQCSCKNTYFQERRNFSLCSDSNSSPVLSQATRFLLFFQLTENREGMILTDIIPFQEKMLLAFSKNSSLCHGSKYYSQ